MPRLTKSELARHRAWLSDWHTPADMAAYVSVINNAMGPADFFGQGGGATERVECAEADIPGRRRGDEYREARKRNAGGGPNVEDDPIEDWIARADQAPVALSAVVATKIGKHSPAARACSSISTSASSASGKRK
jgi:hypothetical protein